MVAYQSLGIMVVWCVIAELTVKISEIQSLVVVWALDVFMVHVNYYFKKTVLFKNRK